MGVHEAGDNELRPMKIPSFGAAAIDLKSVEECGDFMTGHFIL